MKKSELRQIIKEEVRRVLRESNQPNETLIADLLTILTKRKEPETVELPSFVDVDDALYGIKHSYDWEEDSIFKNNLSGISDEELAKYISMFLKKLPKVHIDKTFRELDGNEDGTYWADPEVEKGCSHYDRFLVVSNDGYIYIDTHGYDYPRYAFIIKSVN